MKDLILAGGGGTRLWPLSRINYPKQFLKINSDKSLLQLTVERLLKVVTQDDIVVVTNRKYKFYVKSDLPAIKHVIFEPAGRNTAPATVLGIKYCMEKLACSEDEVIFLCPSDHVIRPDEKFAECLRLADTIAREGYIVTFGVKPDRPETGYGYIKAGKGIGQGKDINFHDVERFIEKPDMETARRYVEDGSYYWNSGMFAFSIKTMLDEIGRHAPEIKGLQIHEGFEDVLRVFEQMPDISIDYAVMEKSDRVVVLPLDMYWNDIGSWDSLYDVLDKDEEKNVTQGDVLAIDTTGTLILGSKRQITTIGLKDCLIVETDDAILVAKKGEAQKVKEAVDILHKASRPEVEEHVTTYRPWGSYTILEDGHRYKIKRIVVNPNEKLSLQMHYHRSEHWVVVKGAARVTVGDKEMYIHENESAYVPKSTMHRLENPGKVPLEIIEVQNGEYVGEDDIIRMEDKYDR
ncbi:MAG: mannose-1-phosphate guanylyltransferase/mannose-6-phosphate isomerase [Dissulfurispiraceae bacterium]|jgi:mannose-1-phosphate guanylyltransferase/mannose-6-phosphate isomerase